jgi:hypothetical protein
MAAPNASYVVSELRRSVSFTAARNPCASSTASPTQLTLRSMPYNPRATLAPLNRTTTFASLASGIRKSYFPPAPRPQSEPRPPGSSEPRSTFEHQPGATFDRVPQPASPGTPPKPFASFTARKIACANASAAATPSILISPSSDPSESANTTSPSTIVFTG